MTSQGAHGATHSGFRAWLRAWFRDGPAPVFLVVLLAAGYHATYFLAGYNTADDGHYAQVAYEFWRGTDPHDVRFGYGLLWHHLGAWAFSLTGPDFAVVQAVFFATITATTALSFLVVRGVTGSVFLAGLAAAACAAVPAFPPTAFYAFCALLNTWAQTRLARPGAGPTALAVGVAAMAVGVTFQIRADFGYVFAVSLIAVTVWLHMVGARASRSGLGPLAGAAAAGFILAHLPLAAAAIAGGWFDLIVEDYLRIPKAVVYVLSLALTGGGNDGAPAAAGTLLARTPLRALWTEGGERAALALLTWAPPLWFALFALFELVAVRRAPVGRRVGRVAEDGVVLVGALAGFPHYFLFRPDLAHIANFTPGLITLLAVFAGRVITAARGRSLGGMPAVVPAAPLLVAPVLVAMGAHVAVYLWLGMVQPGTGSMLVGEGRDRPFVAANGVRVRVNPDEAASLTWLRDLILANSDADRPIVCVPYCPGVAFMTGRRLLFREHYVDDSFLIGDPGWIDRAIAATEAARPPVVVVFDWAINGTDVSRFDVWARRYVEAVERLATSRIDRPGVRAYILAPPGTPAGGNAR